MGRNMGKQDRLNDASVCLPVCLCHVCLPPLVSTESIFSPSRLVTWQEEDVNNVVVGGG